MSLGSLLPPAFLEPLAGSPSIHEVEPGHCGCQGPAYRMQNSEGRGQEERQKTLLAWLVRLTLLPPWSSTVLVARAGTMGQGVATQTPAFDGQETQRDRFKGQRPEAGE